MKSYIIRFLAIIGLFLGLSNIAIGDGVVQLNKPGTKSAKVPVLFKAITVNSVPWFFLKLDSEYTVYTADDDDQEIAHLDVRKDGTVLTINIKGAGSKTIFIKDLRLIEDDNFVINWERIPTKDLQQKAADWGYKINP